MGRETDNDSELVAACRRGDTAAFGVIVERYQRAVCAVAYAAVRDRVLAEDIAQDTFVMAWSKLSALREIERLPAWLCGIARNVARSRSRKNRRETPEDKIEIAGGSTPYDALDGRQTERLVAAALARVPEAYREPLVLFYCEDQSATDVARKLGVSDAAVHKRLSRARQLLAADAQIVEHALGRTVRPRRDLAAAVLAAIAVGIGTSSRVEASTRPRPRGPKSMLKIGTALVVAAGLAGTTAVVASRTKTSDASPASATTTNTTLARGAQPSPARGRSIMTPVRMGMGIAKLNDGSNGLSAPTCEEAGRYMATMAIAGQADLPTKHPVMYADITDQIAAHFADRCEQENWSQDYMTCLLGSTDTFSTAFDCADYASANMFEDGSDMNIAGMGDAQFVLPNRTTPVPPTSDVSCAGVGKHLAELSKPDEASLANVPEDKRQQVLDGMKRAYDAMPAQIEKGCVDAGWTEDRRKCLAAAATATDMGGCL